MHCLAKNNDNLGCNSVIIGRSLLHIVQLLGINFLYPLKFEMRKSSTVQRLSIKTATLKDWKHYSIVDCNIMAMVCFDLIILHYLFCCRGFFTSSVERDYRTAISIAHCMREPTSAQFSTVNFSTVIIFWENGEFLILGPWTNQLGQTSIFVHLDQDKIPTVHSQRMFS